MSGLTFPNASDYVEVPAGTYTLNVNAAGTDQTAITVPNATVAAGGVYSAFAVGTTYAGSLNVLLVQDNAGVAPTHSLPDTGGSPWLLPLMTALALVVPGGAALAAVRSRAG